MPKYLIHMTGDGTPAGVYSDSRDYYDPQWDQLRAAGRQVVLSKLDTVSFNDFAERLAGTTPSRAGRWDTYIDPSSNLEEVLTHARRDVESEGYPEPE